MLTNPFCRTCQEELKTMVLKDALSGQVKEIDVYCINGCDKI